MVVVRTEPLLPNSPSIMDIICQVVAYGSLETKVIFTPSVIKVVAVVYERWLLARGFKYSDLTFSILESWCDETTPQRWALPNIKKH